MKRLLAILGSPHKTGSTASMLNCAVSAAKRAGWEVDTVFLYEKNIGLCKGCRACMDTGICVCRDDLQAIAQKLKECDEVVLSAPTYWANVPGAVKNLFDRLLGVAMEDTMRFPKPRLSKSQRYLLLTACNTPFPFSWLCGQSRGAVRAMKEFFKTSGMSSMGMVVFAGAKGEARLPGSVRKRIESYWKQE